MQAVWIYCVYIFFFNLEMWMEKMLFLVVRMVQKHMKLSHVSFSQVIL